MFCEKYYKKLIDLLIVSALYFCGVSTGWTWLRLPRPNSCKIDDDDDDGCVMNCVMVFGLCLDAGGIV